MILGRRLRIYDLCFILSMSHYSRVICERVFRDYRQICPSSSLSCLRFFDRHTACARSESVHSECASGTHSVQFVCAWCDACTQRFVYDAARVRIKWKLIICAVFVCDSEFPLGIAPALLVFEYFWVNVWEIGSSFNTFHVWWTQIVRGHPITQRHTQQMDICWCMLCILTSPCCSELQI